MIAVAGERADILFVEPVDEIVDLVLEREDEDDDRRRRERQADAAEAGEEGRAMVAAAAIGLVASPLACQPRRISDGQMAEHGRRR